MNKREKLISILFCLIMPLLASGQDRTLEFYYISHDYSTKIGDVCSMLEEKYEMAIEFSDCAMIFYLPDRDNPKVVRMNVEGDNRSEFEDLLSELRGRYAHEAYAYVDLDKITEIFNDVEIIDNEGNLHYQSIRMSWLINPSFWAMNCNETLISSLYFILDFEKYKDYVTIDIWNASDEKIDVNRNSPFGTKNLMGDYPFHMLIM